MTKKTNEEIYEHEVAETVESNLEELKDCYNEEFEKLEDDGELQTLQDKIEFWQHRAFDIFMTDICPIGEDGLEQLKESYPDIDFEDFEGDAIYDIRHAFKNFALEKAEVLEKELAEELEQEKDHSPSP